MAFSPTSLIHANLESWRRGIQGEQLISEPFMTQLYLFYPSCAKT